MEEIKQKGCYVCGKTREYYYKEAKRAVCLECKLSYYSKCKLVKIDGGRMIVDQDEVDRSIKFVSDVLKAMSDHVKVSRIERVYEGFVDCLREYEARLLELIKGFEKASEKDSIEEYTEIVTKISELKEELDSSELMANFTFHRFQVAISQNSRGSSISSGINEIN